VLSIFCSFLCNSVRCDSASCLFVLLTAIFIRFYSSISRPFDRVLLHYKFLWCCLLTVFLCNITRFVDAIYDFSPNVNYVYWTPRYCYSVVSSDLGGFLFVCFTFRCGPSLLMSIKNRSKLITGLDTPWVYQKSDFPQISRQSTHECGKFVSPTYWPPLPSSKCCWYSFLLEVESNPNAIVRLEGLCQ